MLRTVFCSLGLCCWDYVVRDTVAVSLKTVLNTTNGLVEEKIKVVYKCVCYFFYFIDKLFCLYVEEGDII